MSTETHTMPESAFTYGVNFIKLDVIIKLMAEIIPCDVINNQDFNDAFLYLRTTHKECGDKFETYAENEIEEEMDSPEKDEESDVDKNSHQ